MEPITSKRELRGVLTGMILGDSHIEKNGFMTINHSLKQKEYLDYKAGLLENLTAVKTTEPKNKYPLVRVRTRTHPKLKALRGIAYKNGKKQITKKLLNGLTLWGLAILYMDDGFLKHNIKKVSHSKPVEPYIGSRRVYLCTEGFSKKEAEMLKDHIQKEFGINFSLSRKRDKHLLGCGAEEAKKFFLLIRQHIIPSMQYKLDMKYSKSLCPTSNELEDIVRTA